jgi:3-hydroxyphenylacetate 6-hydroxylase
MAIGNLASTLQVAILEKPTASLLVLTIIVPLVYILTNEWVRRTARVPGLSGPAGFPLIGNLWQIRVNAAEKYRDWSRVYGGVYQIQLGNVPVVVVNTAAAAKTLFGQNAQALSSRPEFYTFHKVKGNPLHFEGSQMRRGISPRRREHV